MLDLRSKGREFESQPLRCRVQRVRACVCVYMCACLCVCVYVSVCVCLCRERRADSSNTSSAVSWLAESYQVRSIMYPRTTRRRHCVSAPVSVISSDSVDDVITSLTHHCRTFILPLLLTRWAKKTQSFMRINVATVQDAMKRFYRATLCVKRGLCCRLGSVCPSVTLTYCIDKAEDIIKLLSRPGSLIILVFFDPERCYPIPKGTPLVGRKIHGGGKIFEIVDWNRCLSRKQYEIGPWLQWNVNRKS